MIFTSFVFFGFFALVLALLSVVRSDTARIWLLLIASYLFYANWNPYCVPLILMYGLLGWALGLAIHYGRTAGRRRIAFLTSLVLSLGTLAYFKYANFIGANLAWFFGGEWKALDVVLPVGISFYTFHTLSYLIDLHKGRVGPCHDPAKFMLFVAFFPQLVAGPILRASSFLPQLDRPVRLTRANFVCGAQLFLGGALQKSLFADHLSIFVDQIYQAPQLYSRGTLWLGVAAYSMQIFCDFAGYSLMAIGAARILGFELPENFRMPYLAESVAEFWHRWHISLSTWLRDYLYIGLGGNRRGPLRTNVNVMITMLLGGLWHGASWNFVVWGGLHGAALVVHRIWTQWRVARGVLEAGRVFRLAAWGITLLFCSLLWIPFRSPSFGTTAEYFHGLTAGTGSFTWYHTPTILILLAAATWHGIYRFAPRLAARVPFHMDELTTWPALLTLGYALLLLILLAPLNTKPFIYFQF